MAIRHRFVSDKPDTDDPTIVNASNWNEAHESDDDVFSVKDYGAVGDGVTDDTAAFNDCIQAMKDSSPSSSYIHAYKRPALYIPAGEYIVGALDPFGDDQQPRYFEIRGAGMYATQLTLKAGSTGPIFRQGAYTATPSSWYNTSGYKGEGVNVRDLSMKNPAEWEYNKSRTRESIAWADYGCGQVRWQNVHVQGFKYGFFGAWGSDYNNFVDCDIIRCDVGIYIGPHSNQNIIDKCWFTNCVEGVVIGSAPHVVISSCTFNNPMTRDITIEYNNANRAGVTVSGSGRGIEYGYIAIENCWYESGNAWSTADKDQWDSREFILVTSDVSTSLPYYRIHVRGGYVVDGYHPTYQKAKELDDNGYEKNAYAFLRTTGARNITIENIQANGMQMTCWVAMPETASVAAEITLKNVLSLYGGYHRRRSQGTTSTTQDYVRWMADEQAAFTTASGLFNNTTNPLTVTVSGHGLAVADIVRIENECMYVSAVNGDEFTLQRGYMGANVGGINTTNAAHGDGVQVYKRHGAGTRRIGPLEFFWIGDGFGHATTPGTHKFQQSRGNTNSRYNLRVLQDEVFSSNADPNAFGPWRMTAMYRAVMAEQRNPESNDRTRIRTQWNHFYLEGSTDGGVTFDVHRPRLYLRDNFISWSTGAPVSGSYVQGDLVYNVGASAGGKVGWVCTASGSPGTWKAFGVIDS